MTPERLRELAALEEGQFVSVGGLITELDKPVHGWFELTYAQYLTIPRSILEAMPHEWQERFVACLEQLDATFDWLPREGRYWCRLRDAEGRFVEDPLMQYRRPDYAHIKSLRRKAEVP
jgi:hypothetical protein